MSHQGGSEGLGPVQGRLQRPGLGQSEDDHRGKGIPGADRIHHVDVVPWPHRVARAVGGEQLGAVRTPGDDQSLEVVIVEKTLCALLVTERAGPTRRG